MAKKDENLKPFHQRTENEQREIRQKGGIASGKSRRRKKALRTALKEAVSLTLKELPHDLRVAIMYAANITDMELTVSDAILGSLIRSACAGNSQMMKVLLDVLDETPDVRLKERELKLKERALEGDKSAGVEDVQIMMPEKEMEV
nr:MAG TPA: hypothetical protein [Caudoviricetes sp.]